LLIDLVLLRNIPLLLFELLVFLIYPLNFETELLDYLLHPSLLLLFELDLLDFEIVCFNYFCGVRVFNPTLVPPELLLLLILDLYTKSFKLGVFPINSIVDFEGDFCFCSTTLNFKFWAFYGRSENESATYL
jgi:hypothetical protein